MSRPLMMEKRQQWKGEIKKEKGLWKRKGEPEKPSRDFVFSQLPYISYRRNILPTKYIVCWCIVCIAYFKKNDLELSNRCKMDTNYAWTSSTRRNDDNNTFLRSSTCIQHWMYRLDGSPSSKKPHKSDFCGHLSEYYVTYSCILIYGNMTLVL